MRIPKKWLALTLSAVLAVGGATFATPQMGIVALAAAGDTEAEAIACTLADTTSGTAATAAAFNSTLTIGAATRDGGTAITWKATPTYAWTVTGSGATLSATDVASPTLQVTANTGAPRDITVSVTITGQDTGNSDKWYTGTKSLTITQPGDNLTDEIVYVAPAATRSAKNTYTYAMGVNDVLTVTGVAKDTAGNLNNPAPAITYNLTSGDTYFDWNAGASTLSIKAAYKSTTTPISATVTATGGGQTSTLTVTYTPAQNITVSVSPTEGTAGINNSFVVSAFSNGASIPFPTSELEIYRYPDLTSISTPVFLTNNVNYYYDASTRVVTIPASQAIEGRYRVWYDDEDYADYLIYGSYGYGYGGFISSTAEYTTDSAGQVVYLPVYYYSYSTLSSYYTNAYATISGSSNISLYSSALVQNGSGYAVAVRLGAGIKAGDTATVYLSNRYYNNYSYNYNYSGYTSCKITIKSGSGSSGTTPEVTPDPSGQGDISPAVGQTVSTSASGAELMSNTGIAPTSCYITISGTSTKKTAVFEGPINESAWQVSIPYEVSYDDVSLYVRRIGAKAMKGNSDVETVIIPSTVTQIDKKAFYKCKNLDKVRIYVEDADDLEIEKKAFEGIAADAKIVIYASSKKEFNIVVEKLQKAGAANLKFKYIKWPR